MAHSLAPVFLFLEPSGNSRSIRVVRKCRESPMRTKEVPLPSSARGSAVTYRRSSIQLPGMQSQKAVHLESLGELSTLAAYAKKQQISGCRDLFVLPVLSLALEE